MKKDEREAKIVEYFKKFLELLNNEIDFLFGLRLWIILSVVLVLLILVIVIIIAAKISKRKRMAATSEKLSNIVKDEPVSVQTAPVKAAKSQAKSSEITVGSLDEGEIEYIDDPKPKLEPKQEIKPEPKTEPKQEIKQEIKPEMKGKYAIYKNKEGCHFALLASNGIPLFESDNYSSLSSCKTAISTFKNNVAKNDFEIAKTDSGDYVYLIKRVNGVYTGKQYVSESAAKSGIASVLKNYDTDSITVIEGK